MRYIKLTFYLQFVFLLNSCYNKDSLAGNYSGKVIFGEIELELEENGLYKETFISSGNSPFGATGDKGDKTVTYGSWECDMDYLIKCGSGEGECRKLFLINDNTGKASTYQVQEGYYGWRFIDFDKRGNPTAVLD